MKGDLAKSAPWVATFAAWALAGAAAVKWGMEAAAPAPSAPTELAVAENAAKAVSQWAAKAFGAEVAVERPPESAPVAQAFYTVVGMAVGEKGQGVALISAGSAPARAFAVDDELEPGVLLERIGPESVVISAKGGSQELPAPKKPKALPPIPG